MESIIETKAATLLEFLHGLRGELHVTLEEGTWAAWLYDVLKPHVEEIVVRNPAQSNLQPTIFVKSKALHRRSRCERTIQLAIHNNVAKKG